MSEKDRDTRERERESETDRDPLMPKFEAIGAISETIVLTSTPTSRRYPTTSSRPCSLGARTSLSVPVPSYLNSRISGSPPTHPSPQFRLPSALSVFLAVSTSAGLEYGEHLLAVDAYPLATTTTNDHGLDHGLNFDYLRYYC